MQTFSTALEREFRELANAELELLTNQLVTAGGISTMEDYRRVVGKIEGLNLAIELLNEARARVDRQ